MTNPPHGMVHFLLVYATGLDDTGRRFRIGVYMCIHASFLLLLQMLVWVSHSGRQMFPHTNSNLIHANSNLIDQSTSSTRCGMTPFVLLHPPASPPKSPAAEHHLTIRFHV